MKLLHHTACDFMVYKDYKNRFKECFFSVYRISLRTQYLTYPFIDYHVPIHHNIFLKSLPCEFSHCIFHQLLIIHILINDLLPSNFIQTRHIGGSISTKSNLFVPCDGIFDDFFKFFPCFQTISMGYV